MQRFPRSIHKRRSLEETFPFNNQRRTQFRSDRTQDRLRIAKQQQPTLWRQNLTDDSEYSGSPQENKTETQPSRDQRSRVIVFTTV